MSGRFAPWRIVDLDVAKPVPALPATDGIGGFELHLWLDDVPLGRVRVRAGELPLAAAAVATRVAAAIAPGIGSRLGLPGFEAQPGGAGPVDHGSPDLGAVLAIDDPLASVRMLCSAEAGTTDRVSVVVCTRDRPDDLARCLASLAAVRERPDEIVVVDNAPHAPATRRLVESWPELRYVAEPRAGLSIARNHGIRAAQGDIVAFTDDDAAVHPSWVARIRAAFADLDLLALTGLVLPATLETEAQHVFECELGGFGQGYRALEFGPAFFAEHRWKGVPVWRIGAGANMAFRRRAFDRVGGFDERLGAGAAGCSEDSELWYRLLAAGERCRYDPSLVVWHRHRDEEAALREQMRAYMRGHIVALLIQLQRHRHAGNLIRMLAILPRYYARLALDGLVHGFSPRHRILPSEVTGCLAGVSYWLRHRGDGAPRSPGSAA